MLRPTVLLSIFTRSLVRSEGDRGPSGGPQAPERECRPNILRCISAPRPTAILRILGRGDGWSTYLQTRCPAAKCKAIAQGGHMRHRRFGWHATGDQPRRCLRLHHTVRAGPAGMLRAAGDPSRAVNMCCRAADDAKLSRDRRRSANSPGNCLPEDGRVVRTVGGKMIPRIVWCSTSLFGVGRGNRRLPRRWARANGSFLQRQFKLIGIRLL